MLLCRIIPFFKLCFIVILGGGFILPSHVVYADDLSEAPSIYVSPLNYVAEKYINELDRKSRENDNLFQTQTTYQRRVNERIKRGKWQSYSQLIELATLDGLLGLEPLAVSSKKHIIQRLTEDPIYKKTNGLINFWIQLGHEEYRKLNQANAVRSYQEAINLTREASLEFAFPRDYASLLKNQSLAQIESSKDLGEPLQTLREMIYFDPDISFKPGFYPTETIRLYKGARATIDRELANGPIARFMMREARVVKSDYIISSALIEVADHPVLISFLWKTSDNTPVATDKIVLKKLSNFEIYEAANQLASRLVACILPERKSKDEFFSSRGESKIATSLRFSSTYFLQMKGPAWLVPYPHIGIAADAMWFIYPEFSLVGEIQILSSMSEYSGALVDNYAVIRALVGVDLGFDLPYSRLGIGGFFEFSRFGSISFCYSNDYREVNNNCPNAVKTTHPPIVLGFNIQPHIGVRIVNALEFRLATTIGFYFYPLNQLFMNFPITYELGLVYRF